MTDEDSIWGRTRESRRAIADRLMADLRLDVDHADPPAVAERKERERAARMEAHDRLFAPGYMEINGRRLSRELAGQLGYDSSVDLERRRALYEAASEPDDGELDDYRRD